MNDQEAWELVLANQGLVKTTLEKFLANPARKGKFEFDELLTAAQIGAFEAVKTWDPSRGNLAGYLVSALYHTLQDETVALEIGDGTQVQHGRTREILAGPTDTGELPEEEAEGFEDALVSRLDAEASRDDLRLALEALPERNRDAIVSRVLRGASFPEIGTELGVSKQRAQQIYSRGIEQLREALSES